MVPINLYSGMIAVTRRDLSFDQFMKFLDELKNNEVLPKCVELFLYDPSLAEKYNVVKHYVFIVAWYILQQFRVFSEEDLRQIMERIAQLHKLRPNPYYYEYYSASVMLNKLVFPRPAYIPQLRQALEAIVGSDLCRNCQYNIYCSLKSIESASQKLMLVVNAILHEIKNRPRLRKLLFYLDPSVAYRLMVLKLIKPITRPRFRVETINRETT